MPRHEFGKPVKREALKRSEGRCEAIGEVYGLSAGQRCNAPLSHGVEFDHYPSPAGDPGSDTIENCVSCCRTCHSFKTRTYDVPLQAKGKRVSDKHLGIGRASAWPQAQRKKAPPQHNATRRLTKGVGLAYFEDPQP